MEGKGDAYVEKMLFPCNLNFLRSEDALCALVGIERDRHHSRYIVKGIRRVFENVFKNIYKTFLKTSVSANKRLLGCKYVKNAHFSQCVVKQKVI